MHHTVWVAGMNDAAQFSLLTSSGPLLTAALPAGRTIEDGQRKGNKKTCKVEDGQVQVD